MVEKKVRCTAVVLAAGTGSRMKANVAKQFLELAGRPLIYYSLKAVEDCDLFFGIIRPDCGTGRVGSESITFQEFKHARKCHKPCWYVIDSQIKSYKKLLKTLVLREFPDTRDEDLNFAISAYYDKQVRGRKQLPKVLDIFETKDFRQFDPLCFEMEDFVNQKGMPKETITNNWMQYCDHELDIANFIHTNFGDRVFIEDILKEV